MPSNELKFSDEARRAMQLSEDIAREFAHATVEPGHLLTALRITGGAPSLALQDMQVTLDLLKALVHTEYGGVIKRRVASEKLELSTGIKQVLQYAVDYARRWKHARIGTTHLMLGLIQFQDVTITRLLEWTALLPSELSDFVLDRVKMGTPPADYFGELPDEPKGILALLAKQFTTRHRQPRTILVMTPPSPSPSVQMQTVPFQPYPAQMTSSSGSQWDMQERQFKDQVDAHEKAGDTDAAIETCTHWIEYNPDSVHAYAMRGNLKVKKNDEDGAIADYTEVIRLDPRSYNAHYVRGCHYLKKRQIDAAIADFDAAIKRDPKDRGAYYSRSVAHLYNTQFTRTLEDTTIAIRLDNKDYCAFLYRGLARGELGDLDGAEEDFRQMLALHPESEATAFINLGWLERLRGNYDKALELLNKAEQLEPEYEAIYWTRGKVYALKEDRALAVSDYKRALALRHGIETKWSLRFLHEMEAYIEQWGSSAE